MVWLKHRLADAPTRALSLACLAVLAALVIATWEREERSTSNSEGDDVESFIQLRHQHRFVATNGSNNSKQLETCALLRNQGSHFTVDVEVGTPGQKLSVVADTGSNNFWVVSCACAVMGECFGGRCFTGTNHSSTFQISGQDTREGPPAVVVTYGSGPVQMVVASDFVKVGSISVMMNNTLYLAINHNLRIGSGMEGILGLGIPQQDEPAPTPPPRRTPRQTGIPTPISPIHRSIPIPMDSDGTPYNPMASPDGRPVPMDGGGNDGNEGHDDIGDVDINKILEKVLRKILGGGGRGASGIAGGGGAGASGMIDVPGASGRGYNLAEEATGDLRMLMDLNESLALTTTPTKKANSLEAKGFLEVANIDTFQICFNDGDADGALRLRTPKKNGMKSYGVQHWGLGFSGISVGNESATPRFCTQMQYPEQETPCGAIPDSGTTLITVPSKTQLVSLLTQICDGWDRCKRTVAKYDILSSSVKATVLTRLLKNCSQWIDEAEGLNELPSLYFHMTGKNGVNQTLELTPWAYILESTYANRTKLYDEFIYPHEMEPTSQLQEEEGKPNKTKKAAKNNATNSSFNPFNQSEYPTFKVCSLQFDVMPYSTKMNGDIWILGTSFFYQFQVGYNIKDLTMSFTPIEDEPCGTGCGASLTQLEAEKQRTKASRQRPRFMNAHPRSTSIDTSLPF